MGERAASPVAAAAAAATWLSAWADAAFPQLELLAKRLGAAARPFLRFLSSAYEGVPDETVGFVVAVFLLWLLLSSARHYLSRGGAGAGAGGGGAAAEAEAEAEEAAEAEAKAKSGAEDGSEASGAKAGAGAAAGTVSAVKAKGGKPGASKAKEGKPRAAKADKAGNAKAPGEVAAAAAAAAAGRKWDLFAPLRGAASVVDKRLEAYTAEIALAVWIARLVVGAALLAYGVAAKFGAISFREHFDDGTLSDAEVAEAEAIWVRFSSTAGVGLSIIVLLPALLPMPKKTKEEAAQPVALHPADELLRS